MQRVCNPSAYFSHPRGLGSSISIHESRYVLLIVLCLVSLTIIAYWQVLRSDFIIFDDDGYVYNNPMVQKGLTRESIPWAFTSMAQANWHPMTWLSHMLDCQIHGLRPWGHHLSSLLLHIANGVLLLFVLRRATGSLWRSSFVAAVFAVHPLHVESAAWVAERKDVLSAFFWLLACWCYIRYVERLRVIRYVLVVVSFALGLMAKPMLVTLPFALLLLDYWPLGRLETAGTQSERVIRRNRIGKLLWEKIPLFLLSAASSIITYLAQQGSGAVISDKLIPFGIRFQNAFLAYIKYIGKTLWPRGLAVYYPHPAWSLPTWQALAAALLLIIASFQVFRLWKRHPYLLVGWLWYLGILVPVIGFVQVGGQAIADRYMYLPLVGIAIMAAWGIPELLTSPLWAKELRGLHSKKLLALSAGLVISILTALTYQQVGYWRDSGILFEHTLSVTANNPMIHNNLGLFLKQKGKLEEAIAHFSEAVRIQPNDSNWINNLGIALAEQGRLDEAIDRYDLALRLMPDLADAHYNKGVALLRKEKYKEAAGCFSKALSINPRSAEAHYNLALTMGLLKRPREAITHYREALRIKPDYVDALNELASLQNSIGMVEESIASYRESLRWSPDQPGALNNLAWSLATSQDEKLRSGEEAVRFATKACELISYSDANVLGTLAAAYAEAGRFDEARQTAQRAIGIVLASGEKGGLPDLQEQLELYKKHQPYHER